MAVPQKGDILYKLDNTLKIGDGVSELEDLPVVNMKELPYNANYKKVSSFDTCYVSTDGDGKTYLHLTFQHTVHWPDFNGKSVALKLAGEDVFHYGVGICKTLVNNGGSVADREVRLLGPLKVEGNKNVEELFIGNASTVTQLEFIISGKYAEKATNTLIKDTLHIAKYWFGTPSYIAAVAAMSGTNATDGGALNLIIGGTPVIADGGVAMPNGIAEISQVVGYEAIPGDLTYNTNISTPYITYGKSIELSVTADTGNTAENLVVNVFVVEGLY